MGIHRTDNGSDRRFLIVAGWWVCDIGAEENDGFIEHLEKNNERKVSEHFSTSEFMSRKKITLGRMVGTRILLTPPSLTLIFRHKLDKV